MTLDWQVLLMALVAISSRLALLATSLQPEEARLGTSKSCRQTFLEQDLPKNIRDSICSGPVSVL